MKRSRTSEMWSYFEILDREFAKCTLCGKKLSYKSTTTNLKKHLQKSHLIVDFSSQRPSELDLGESLPVEVILGTSSVEEERAAPAPSMQQGVQSSMTSYLSKRIGVNQKKKIDEQLLQLFTKDFQPFSVVEDSGFRGFVRALNPGYELPSRKHISDVMLQAAYTAAKEKVVDKLSAAKTVCLTTDCWTSAANEGYMAVTGHFVSEDFTLQSVLLGCSQLSGAHTAPNLSASLIGTTDNFRLTDKVLLVVTDNAPNIKNAVSILKWKHFGCYAHTLNLIVQNALKHFVSIQQKVKTIVAFFKRSCKATERLLTYQQNNGAGHVKKLVQEVPTRWNSTLYMLERIVEIKDAVKTSLVLFTVDFEQLTDEEWNICSELCSVLKPFAQVSTQLSAESYPTGSQVIVLTRGLLSVCAELLKRPFNSVTRTIIEELTKGLKDRFHNVEMSKSIGVATLLDPRFKSLVFESRVAADNAKKQLIELVAQKMGDRRLTNTGQSHETVSTSTTTDPLSVWGVYDAIVKSTQPQGTPQSAAIVEVQSSGFERHTNTSR
ncbi:E3 SUMO-protein ligase ZBED1-like isoform X2 [Schistocerca americana]|uniref:E3 SUMO-protein ligase ZBED1-like isoform X2 n=1 Tax=Schistocerca americana TaxID=7009 RepID=UPI001F4F8A4C|nr:E3 SUMO-protein ligase ZBED1-like isoform X2 [Schistocerca americana]XP_046983715.1 E3 SUMO-protein ligase ZBED1-like isoform X2 [Schistocerca americana]XP_046983716.1 E3 SUMO-protein ligase ZBED1-like isoform X2 [Schistocerca americana]